jgi:molybdopterin-guanine dinucleotide biosynthesis protein A
MHHLVALWPVTTHCIVYRTNRDRAAFTTGLAMWRVDFPPVAWDPFPNVNTPDDLSAAHVLAIRREARWKP